VLAERLVATVPAAGDTEVFFAINPLINRRCEARFAATGRVAPIPGLLNGNRRAPPRRVLPSNRLPEKR